MDNPTFDEILDRCRQKCLSEGLDPDDGTAQHAALVVWTIMQFADVEDRGEAE